jgi:hypothetical protein
MDIGTMHRGVASRRPTGAAFHEISMVNLADIKFAGQCRRTRYLRMTFKTKIIVALDEKLPVDRAVWVVTNGAAVT